MRPAPLVTLFRVLFFLFFPGGTRPRGWGNDSVLRRASTRVRRGARSIRVISLESMQNRFFQSHAPPHRPYSCGDLCRVPEGYPQSRVRVNLVTYCLRRRPHFRHHDCAYWQCGHGHTQSSSPSEWSIVSIGSRPMSSKETLPSVAAPCRYAAVPAWNQRHSFAENCTC